MRLRLLDYVIIGICAAGIAVSAAFVYSGGSSAPRVVITGQDGEWIYPLDKDRHVEVQGPIGVTVVAIHDGSVKIEDSPCPNKTCVQGGGISGPGQWRACLPNAVFVRIEGGAKETGVDAAVY